MSYKREEYIHSWYLLLMTFCSLVLVLINKNIYINLLIIVFCLFFYFKNNLKLTTFVKVLSYAFVFSLTFFALNIIHHDSLLLLSEREMVERSLRVMNKVFLVSLLSMTSAVVIDYSKVLLYLMAQKKIKIFIGYPLLLAMNSIALFKDEHDRIKINAKQRELPFKDRLNIFFPLLVFAIRHSQRGALSLVSRGLNEEKNFYNNYEIRINDKINMIVFFAFYLVLVAVAIFLVR